MNERTSIQIEEMKKQTIGVEVEMYNITREKACRTIAAYYGTEDTVRYLGGSYYAWACKDNQGREWKITRDSSIHADRDEEKTEMTGYREWRCHQQYVDLYQQMAPHSLVADCCQ